MNQPPDPELRGVRALVTGGTSGLGFAMGQALADAGPATRHHPRAALIGERSHGFRQAPVTSLIEVHDWQKLRILTQEFSAMRP